jgi:hypothetical protein
MVMNGRSIVLTLALLASMSGLAPRAGPALERVPAWVSTISTYPYNMTGLVDVDVAQGSGVVVEHPKIFITAAHVLFDDFDFAWDGSPTFFRRYEGRNYPPASLGTRAVGIWFFQNYSRAVRNDGGNSFAAFQLDIAVAWAFEYLADGGFAGWWNDGRSAAQSSREKLVTGYPSACRDGYFMHEVGGRGATFPLKRNTPDYWRWEGFRGCAGMSGGPLWVRGSGGDYLVAGVHVSSGINTVNMGVRLVNANSRDLIWEAAANIAKATKNKDKKKIIITKQKRYDGSRGDIPDDQKAKNLPIPVIDDMPESVAHLELTCVIRHPRSRDLVVQLVAPSGRAFTVSNRAPSKGSPYRCESYIDKQQLVKRFKGVEANGRWKLRVKDLRAGRSGRVEKLKFRMSANGRFDDV